MSSKSKIKIGKTLVNLMEKSNFEDITVSEICAFSKVSRGTFYNNFTSKEDILSTMIRKEITEKLEQFVSTKEDFMEDMAYLFFESSKERCDYISLLIKQNLFRLFRQELVNVFSHHDSIVKQKIFLEIPKQVRPYVISVYIASSLAIYRKWAEGGLWNPPKKSQKYFWILSITQKFLIPNTADIFTKKVAVFL